MKPAQQQYIEVLAATGSPVKARKTAGVTGRTVANWKVDDAFAEAYDDAIEAARDAVIQKARQMALDGSEGMLSLLVRAYTPELRPAGTNVALQVNTTQSAVSDVDAVRLADQLNNLQAQLANRVEGQLPVPAVDPGPVIEVPAAAQEGSGAPLASGEGLDPSAIC